MTSPASLPKSNVVPLRVGVVGCGTISRAYLKMMRVFDCLDVVACADLDPERASALARDDPDARLVSVTLDKLFADPSIDLVVNLTVPKAHADVSSVALESGKAVYSEKPLAMTGSMGRRLLELAHERGLGLGCAPDTFLGAGPQTCRAALDKGLIGEPIGAVVMLASHGPEEWHADPKFFYEPGAGPLFDVGPYQITTMISLLGPVRAVSALAMISSPKRLIRAGARRGETLVVTTPTHVTGVMELTSGIPVTFLTSFDVWAHHLPYLEIYGTEGTLALRDSDGCGEVAEIWQASTRQWRTLERVNAYTDQVRGLGVADLASALRSGRPARASGELALHVLDVMEATLHREGALGVNDIASTADRPEPVRPGLRWGEID